MAVLRSLLMICIVANLLSTKQGARIPSLDEAGEKEEAALIKPRQERAASGGKTTIMMKAVMSVPLICIMAHLFAGVCCYGRLEPSYKAPSSVTVSKTDLLHLGVNVQCLDEAVRDILEKEHLTETRQKRKADDVTLIVEWGPFTATLIWDQIMAATEADHVLTDSPASLSPLQ